MSSDFRNYAYARIDKALMGSVEYKKVQDKHGKALENKQYDVVESLSDELEARAQELCYVQGFNDAMQLIMKGANIND